ncbi:MAG: dihydroorotase [Rickettsiales bacterium]|nr:dihydroorotase [Rickettsiales bacterium]
MFDLIIKGGTCITPSGALDVDIGIQGDTITQIGELDSDQAEQIIDAKGLHVLPGVMDTQVHFREPGNEHKEDLEHGTRGAVLGGVTTIFEMPNTSPPTTNRGALEDKISRMKDRAWSDFAFFVGGTPEADVDWHTLECLPGCCGIKIFMGSSTGNLLVSQDEAIEAILEKSERRIAVHCEDEARLVEQQHIAEEGGHARFHPKWRDEETALRATTRLLSIARKTGKRVHTLHITTAQEMELLAKYKDVATVEVLPQHLTFDDSIYETLGSYAQMNPPIRAKHHQEALWRAINNGLVDTLGSDHAPHTRQEKDQPYPNSPSGMPGVQTLVPIMLNHVNNGKLTLERFVDLVCHGPQRIYNIVRKGRIALGYDADFTLVDMNKERTITDSWMACKAGWTPYHGKKVKGWPTHTIIRGSVIMEHDKLVGSQQGKPVRFADTLTGE